MVAALVFLAIFLGGLWMAIRIDDALAVLHGALAVLHGAPTQPDPERTDA